MARWLLTVALPGPIRAPGTHATVSCYGGESVTEGVIAGACVLASVVWLLKLGAVARHREREVWLAGLPDDAPTAGWPTLAVLVAARDEGPHIDRAVRSMLAQNYPGLEVIAVDDRSTDDTGAILDTIAAEDDRLRVVHVHELPPGWLGKTHALQRAAEVTAADWLLFTDADVVFTDGALRRAVRFAEAAGGRPPRGRSRLSVRDGGRARPRRTLLHDARGGRAHRRCRRPEECRACGNRGIQPCARGAFRAIGGFEHLALSVDDDRRLGEALKASGHRGRVLLGPGAVEVRWHVGLAGLIRGVEKNLFALLNYRIVTAALFAVTIVWLCAGPHAGLLVGPWWTRAVCASGVGAIAILMAVTGRRGGGVGWPDALVVPLGGCLIAIAMLRSVAVTLGRGGVRCARPFVPARRTPGTRRLPTRWLSDLASHRSQPVKAEPGSKTV